MQAHSGDVGRVGEGEGRSVREAAITTAASSLDDGFMKTWCWWVLWPSIGLALIEGDGCGGTRLNRAPYFANRSCRSDTVVVHAAAVIDDTIHHVRTERINNRCQKQHQKQQRSPNKQNQCFNPSTKPNKTKQNRTKLGQKNQQKLK